MALQGLGFKVFQTQSVINDRFNRLGLLDFDKRLILYREQKFEKRSLND